MCLEAFGHVQRIDSIIIEVAFAALSEKEYTPDTLEMIGIDHLSQIAQIPEGHAASLIKFSKCWSSKADHKHAKLTHNRD
jgi:hypothetical protein